MFLYILYWQSLFFFFFFNDTATTEIYTLSLHDALPISDAGLQAYREGGVLHLLRERITDSDRRSEEHTSELQSQSNLVCRLLLEKKKKNRPNTRQPNSRHHSSYNRLSHTEPPVLCLVTH